MGVTYSHWAMGDGGSGRQVSELRCRKGLRQSLDVAVDLIDSRLYLAWCAFDNCRMRWIFPGIDPHVDELAGAWQDA